MKKRLIMILAMSMCMFLCACGGSEGTSGGLFEKEEEVEITMDNWQDYFEFKEIVLPWNTYNAFDELESENVTIDYCIVLKDEYEIDEEKSKVAIEYTGYREEWSIDVDMSTLDITYIEKVTDVYADPLAGQKEFNRTGEFSNINFKNSETEYYGIQISGRGEPNITWFHEETQTRTNIRCFLDEVIRIQGTIYIKEK